MNVMALTKKIIPGIASLATFLYSEPNPGWTTVKEAIDAKNGQMFLQSAVASLTGVRLAGAGQAQTEVDVFGILNPIDFRNAPTPKVFVITRLAIEGIDAVGTFVSKLLKDLVK